MCSLAICSLVTLCALVCSCAIACLVLSNRPLLSLALTVRVEIATSRAAAGALNWYNACFLRRQLVA